MNNKKGFVFIETIITIVVLTTTLVLLYVSYSGAYNDERDRLYSDDIAYIYKTIMIKNLLENNLYIESFKEKINNSNMYLYFFRQKSSIYESNYNKTNVEDYDMSKLVNLYNIQSLIYIKYDQLDDLKKCLKTNEKKERCNNSISNITAYGDIKLKDYLLKLSVDKSNVSKSIIGEDEKGILIALFYEAKDGTNLVNDYKTCIEYNIFKNKFDISGYDFSEKEKKYTRIDNDLTEEGIEQKNKDEQDALSKYYKSDISYNMNCENAYYIAWVYL